MSESKSALSIKFTYISDNEIHYAIDLGDGVAPEDLSNQLFTLLTYMRSAESLKEITSLYKKICKNLKDKNLYRDFTDLLKAQALQRLVEKESPMISSLEVLGRKRMS